MDPVAEEGGDSHGYLMWSLSGRGNQDSAILKRRLSSTTKMHAKVQLAMNAILYSKQIHPCQQKKPAIDHQSLSPVKKFYSQTPLAPLRNLPQTPPNTPDPPIPPFLRFRNASNNSIPNLRRHWVNRIAMG